MVLLKSFGALFRDVRLVPAKSLAEAAPSEVTSSFVGCAGDKSPVMALPIYGRAGLVTEQRRNNVSKSGYVRCLSGEARRRNWRAPVL